MDNYKWNKIELIKIARQLIKDMGLVDAKTLVEAWMMAFDADDVDCLSDAMKFLKFIYSFIQGSVGIENGVVVYTAKPYVSAADIRSISEGRGLRAQ